MPDAMSETIDLNPGEALGVPEREDEAEELFVAPTSFAQRRLWLLARVQPGSAAYNVPVAWRVYGPLYVTALTDTLAELVARHETLRTVFDEEEGEPVQVDRSRLASGSAPGAAAGRSARRAGPEAAAQRLIAADVALPFDLSRAPLFRAQLFRLAGEEHLLFLNLHHIITDGWSLGILVRELSTLYAAFCAGQPSPLPDLPIQYADFAEWQRQWLQGEALEQKLRPWRQRLSGAPESLSLPTDRPRSADAESGRCGFVSLVLGAPLSAALRQMARGAGTTLYMTLLAGFQALLFRHSGQPDLVVGSPVANRNRTEIEGLIGYFINLLAQRGDLSGDPPFEQLLERVRVVAVEALGNEDLPFEKLVEELRPDRRLQPTPLFSVLFALQQPQTPPAAGAGLRWELAEVRPATAKFDLSLQLIDEPGEISGFWDYDAELFDASTVARLGRHLATLLADAAAHPQRRLGELALLEASEWHQIAVEWNDAASVYPRQVTVHGLIAAQAERTPDAPALVSIREDGTEQVVTYGELVRRARRLAGHLRALGVGRESPVGVFLERGPEMIAAWLGILEAGGAYLPLDPSYPAERIAFMLRDAGVACVVTRGARGGGLAASLDLDSSIPRLELDELPDVPPLAEQAGEARAESLAYVLYTSGSTGNPKGVAVTHRSVLRLVRSHGTFVGFNPADRVAQLASVSFDLAVFETWGALLNGAPLVLFDRATAVSPEALFRALRERTVATAFLTSTLFHRMANLDAAGFRGMPNLLVGGETVDPSRAAEVLAAGAPVRLINSYGPTECAVFAICGRVSEIPPGAGTVPIGRPIANTTAIVLDAGLQPAPAGVTGELCLGGDGLARGYLGRPDLTAERFVPAPFALGGTIDPGARLYRTGDLARLRPDGGIDCLGRADDQVKIRGVRIEPGEVEAVLAAHPGIAECAVGARRTVASNTAGELSLAAWIVPRRRPAPTAQELREHLQSRLPGCHGARRLRGGRGAAAHAQRQARPRRAARPRGSRGGRLRIRAAAHAGRGGPRRHLRLGAAPRPARPAGSVRLRGPDGPDRSLRQLLRPRRALADRHGGDLAGALHLSGRAAHPRHLQGADPRRTGAADRNSPPRPRGVGAARRHAGAAQRRHAALLRPATPLVPRRAGRRRDALPQHHRSPSPPGRLDAAALAGAFDEIVRRHEALRTTFRTGPDGTPVQTVHPHRPFPLPLADLTGLPPDLRESEGRRLAILSAAQPFALTRGPLLRATLLRLDVASHAASHDESHAVLLAMHHIVSDGWSLEIFVRELVALYRAFAAGQPSPLPRARRAVRRFRSLATAVAGRPRPRRPN